MAANDEISFVERCIIRPSVPSTPQHLFLSSMDLFWLPCHYARCLLFYSTPGGSPQQDAFISTLKAGLALVLVPFYPVAGRLAYSTQSHKRVCIDCNDAGVEFLAATVSAQSPHFDQLQADDFQPCPFFNKLAPYDTHSSSEIFDLPLLSIQVTRLGLEGLALGIAHSHVLADGHSNWHLMNSWAECARREPLSMPPLHKRTALAIETPSENRAILRYPPEGLSVSEGTTGSPLISKKPLKERYFQCSREMVQRLKAEANCEKASSSCAKGASSAGIVDGGNYTESTHDKDMKKLQRKEESKGNDYSFTSYEALCGHWWKRVTRARGLEGSQMVSFGVFADMRSRLSPKLPPAYFGNAVIADRAYASAAEILEEGLGQTAARVHEVSLALHEDSLWGFLNWLELHNHTLTSKSFINVPDLTTVNSPHFQVYDVDFGYGRPIAVRTARTKGDGEMVLFAPADGRKGGVDVCLPLTISAMDELLKDPSLCL